MYAKVLVVEDDPIIAFDIRQYLADQNYTVIGVVPSGEQALDKVHQSMPDIILMDIKLKGSLNGIQTAKRIQDEFEIPIVFVSAYLSPFNLQKLNHLGPCKYLSKPFDNDQLESNIQMALVQRKIENRLSANQLTPTFN